MCHYLTCFYLQKINNYWLFCKDVCCSSPFCSCFNPTFPLILTYFNPVDMFLTDLVIHSVHWLLFRYPPSPVTPQSRSPAWSPSSCGGCLVGLSSCLLWPSDRQNNTTLIANLSRTQSRYRHDPQHCRSAPLHSSLSLLRTPAGRRM